MSVAILQFCFLPADRLKQYRVEVDNFWMAVGHILHWIGCSCKICRARIFRSILFRNI